MPNSHAIVRRINLFTFVMFICIVPASAPAKAATPFVHETVDATGSVGEYTSIALDVQGNPHMTYRDLTNADLKYAVRSGASWVIETVDAAGTVGRFTSIGLDGQGNPHVSYWTLTSGDLKYAVKSGGSWMIETVDATGNVGQHTSLALDAQGNPHISYYDVTINDLKYAVKSGGIWNTETVDATGTVGWFTSIGLDAQGNPHVSYYDVSNGDLKYAVKNGGSWTLETVDTTGDVGHYTSLALDAQGNPHVSYHDVTNDDLKYAVKTGGVWGTPETVDATGSTGRYTSLELDAQGDPHVSYYDFTNRNLKYAVKSGGSWTLETVDALGSVGSESSLALDTHGNPHMSYFDSTNFVLKFTGSSIHLTSPAGGENWPVGGIRTVEWNGAGAIDILLSVDGGGSFDLLKTSVSGGGLTGGSFDLLVPHRPSRFCVVKIERTTPFSTSESDSFFTIETSVSLLSLSVFEPEGLPGLTVSWNTDPGPEDLDGYRLEKKPSGGDYVTLVTRIAATSYHDADGRDGDSYRLFAINGVGDEFFLGETGSDRVPTLRNGLTAFPLPFRRGDLTIEFATTVGGVPLDTEVAIYDVLGRKVKTVVAGVFTSPTHRVMWDGKDGRGNLVASGIYFIRAKTAVSAYTQKLVIVR